ncbi:hypothetical protein GCM10008022_22310 [Paenibacillus hunanensis]|nr:hypothetical protein GCM10008022_22310 [Paenibacillus hunanensis]
MTATINIFDDGKEYVTILFSRELGQVKANVQNITEAIPEKQAELTVGAAAFPALTGTRIARYVAECRLYLRRNQGGNTGRGSSLL